MKKTISILLALLLVFTFTACRSLPVVLDGSMDPTMAGAPSSSGSSDPDTDAVVDKAPVSNNKDEQAPPPEEKDPYEKYLGTYSGKDRFSGEGIDGLELKIYEVTDDHIVFDLITPNNGTFRGITAFFEGERASIDVSGDGKIVSVWFEGSKVCVDVAENMGAMAYDFYK